MAMAPRAGGVAGSGLSSLKNYRIPSGLESATAVKRNTPAGKSVVTSSKLPAPGTGASTKLVANNMTLTHGVTTAPCTIVTTKVPASDVPVSGTRAPTASNVSTTKPSVTVANPRASAPAAPKPVISTYINSKVTPFLIPDPTLLPLPHPSKPGSIIKTSKATHQCFICSKFFETPEDRREHVKTHRQGPFQCDECDSVFETIPALQVHIQEHRRQDPKPLNVNKAQPVRSTDKRSPTKATAKPHKCSICKKTFKVRNQLIVHKKTHANEKAPSGRSSKKKGGKKKQTVTSRKQKTFSCTECDRVFKDTILLDKHMITKHPEAFQARFDVNRPKVFKCVVCMESFSSKETLRTHYEKHTTYDVIALDVDVKLKRTRHFTDGLFPNKVPLTRELVSSGGDDCISVLASAPKRPLPGTAGTTEPEKSTSRVMAAEESEQVPLIVLDTNDVVMSTSDDVTLGRDGDVADGDSQVVRTSDNGVLEKGSASRSNIDFVLGGEFDLMMGGNCTAMVDNGDAATGVSGDGDVDIDEIVDMVMGEIDDVPMDYDDDGWMDDALIEDNDVPVVVRSDVNALETSEKNSSPDVSSESVDKRKTCHFERNERPRENTDKNKKPAKNTGRSEKRCDKWDDNTKIRTRSKNQLPDKVNKHKNGSESEKTVAISEQKRKKSTRDQAEETVSVTSPGLEHDNPNAGSEEDMAVNSSSTPETLVSNTCCTLFTCSICGQTFDDPSLLLRHSHGHSNKNKTRGANTLVDSALSPPYQTYEHDCATVNDRRTVVTGTTVSSVASPSLTVAHDKEAACNLSQKQSNCQDLRTVNSILDIGECPPVLTKVLCPPITTNELCPPTLTREPAQTIVRQDNEFTYDCVRCNVKVTGSWHLFLHIRAHMDAKKIARGALINQRQ